MYSELDNVLHSQVRLAIISILLGVEEAEFSYLKQQTKATAGNLSFQIVKLNEAGYIKIIKGYKDNYPLTTLKITAKGIKAFEAYVENIKKYLKL